MFIARRPFALSVALGRGTIPLRWQAASASANAARGFTQSASPSATVLQPDGRVTSAAGPPPPPPSPAANAALTADSSAVTEQHAIQERHDVEELDSLLNQIRMFFPE
jgi:hypothetical protein